MEVKEVLARYIVQLEADGRSTHTIGQVTRHVRLLAKWIGEIEIEDVRHEDIAEFLASHVVKKRADGAPRKTVQALWGTSASSRLRQAEATWDRSRDIGSPR